MAVPLIGALSASQDTIGYISYLESLKVAQEERADLIAEYRDYYDGRHKTKLTTAQKQIINLDTDGDIYIVLNICKTIVNALVQRLKVQTFEVAGDTMEFAQKELSRWWRLSRLDALSPMIHRDAARDGTTYALVEFDPNKMAPVVTAQPEFDGESGMQVYTLNDYSQEILVAVKRWHEEAYFTPEQTRRERANVWYPNRVEYWVRKAGRQWEPYLDPKDTPTAQAVEVESFGRKYKASVAWWTDDGTATGIPLGMPVVPFRNADDGSPYGESELADIVPGVQEAINKTFVDVIIAGDIAALPIITLAGDAPKRKDDGTYDLPPLGSGAILFTPETGASWGQVIVGDISKIDAALDGHIARAAKITSTPLSMFQSTGQVAAEGTLKQQDAALDSKVADRQPVFGNSWEDVARLMIIADKVFNQASKFRSMSFRQITQLDIACKWRDMTPRNDEDVRENAKALKELGLPLKKWVAELGYEGDELIEIVDAIEADETAKMKLAAQAFAQAGRTATTPNGTASEPPTNDAAPARRNTQQNGANNNGLANNEQ